MKLTMIETPEVVQIELYLLDPIPVMVTPQSKSEVHKYGMELIQS